MILTHVIYTLVLWLALPLLFLHWMYGRFVTHRYRVLPLARMGFFRLRLPFHKRRILVHAVSVGESVAAQPLVKALKQKYPQDLIVFSNVTETGHARAKESIEADGFVMFPYDYATCVVHFLNRVRPSLVLILETEIWPNFLAHCKARQIPVVFVNARISPKSFDRYRLVRFLLAPYLQGIPFLTQTEEDKQKALYLGAGASTVCGNLKFDQLKLNLLNPVRKKLSEDLRSLDLSIVFGSAHLQEALQFLALQKRLKDKGFVIRTCLAPRHFHYLPAILHKADTLELSVHRRSQGQGAAEVLILDTYGELSLIYEQAPIAVIGGSFEPIGGHSILEPALFGRAILYGPNMQNIEEVSREFESSGASFRVDNYTSLEQKLELLLINPDLGQEIGTRAKDLLEAKFGATERILWQILPHL